ncbi:hypothetical protein LCGC14_1526180 [marine sediment metagenome]|uniref:HTH cro/C1-type domain-containing protein n=1 Tax=marine sediment metagenome TaxID=412755 RepID=A0A0F9IX41_9ZZZZ
MTNRLECCGVILEGPPWTVDGDPMKSADHAVAIFFARLYNSTQDLPRALVQYHRRVVGVGLACPMVMIRRERDRAGITSQRELARLSGVSKSAISAIERGDTNPTARVMFDLLHACQNR